MALAPVSQLSVPYEDFKNYFLKFYLQGTTTPLAMFTDATGLTSLAKAEISGGGATDKGFIITPGDVIFIPYVGSPYDAWLFPTAAEADANDTSNATQIANNISVTAGLETETIADLRLFEPSFDGQQTLLLGHTDAGIGGDTFYFDQTDTTSADNNSTIIVTSGGARWKRTTRIDSSISSQDFGTPTDLGIDANTVLVSQNLDIAKGSLPLATPISLAGKRNVFGVGAHEAGSVVTLSGDNLFMQTIATPSTRYRVKGIQVNGDAQTTSATIELKQAFLYQFDESWLKSCFRGVTIEDSDSVVFNGLRVMETSKDYAVEVDDGCTNIIFNYSNFETGGEGFVNGGKIKIDSQAIRVSTVDLNSCQFERSGVDVIGGSVRMTGGKLGDTSCIVLGPRSQTCVIDSVYHTGAEIRDIGFNNVVKNAYARNMSTPEHRWPTPVSNGAGTTPTFGAAGEEWLFIASVRAKGSLAVTGATIEFKDGAGVLDTSPAFNLFAQGTSIGQENRPIFSYMTAVKTVTNPIEVDAVGVQTSFAGIRGAECINTNATFDAGTSTGWTGVDAVFSPSGSDLLVTPSNATWGIFQNIASILSIGKKYIAVIKYTGVGNLVLGQAWDGSDGERKVIAGPIIDPYGDGDDVQMISFEYLGQASNISFGSVSSSSAVTVRYFAIIEA